MNTAYDVVVIGGGLAGLAAANRCVEAGLAVAILETGIEGRYMCNTRLAMGFINIAGRDVFEPPAQLAERIGLLTQGAARPDLGQAFAHNVGAAVRWLHGYGVWTIRGNWRPGCATMLAPPAAIGAGLHWLGRGGDVMLRKLERAFVQAGGAFFRGTRARRLLMQGRQCVGVVARGTKGLMTFSAKHVVVADGGFQSNAAMLRQYITAVPKALLQRNAESGNGDGIRMVQEAGGAVVGMEGFYGHLHSIDALHNPKLWPYPNVDMAVSGGIVVNRSGMRIADEGSGGIHIANVIARQSDPLGTVAIFDHITWMQRANGFPLPANPLLAIHGGTIHRGDDMETLAQQAGIDSTALCETVRRFNAASRDQAVLLEPRRSETFPGLAVDAPPFYAVPLVAGITYTTGGISIDPDGRVQHVDGGVIGGLYAAGSATGGHEGGPSSAYTGGLGKALTFGFLVGSAIVRSSQASSCDKRRPQAPEAGSFVKRIK